MKRVRSLLVVCLIGAAAACSDDTTTTPTTPTPTTFTEVFSGTLNRNGATSHSFISQASGTVTATLTSVTPDATQVVGLALGTWTGAACQIIIAADRATPAAVRARGRKTCRQP